MNCEQYRGHSSCTDVYREKVFVSIEEIISKFMIIPTDKQRRKSLKTAISEAKKQNLALMGLFVYEGIANGTFFQPVNGSIEQCFPQKMTLWELKDLIDLINGRGKKRIIVGCEGRKGTSSIASAVFIPVPHPDYMANKPTKI